MFAFRRRSPGTPDEPPLSVRFTRVHLIPVAACLLGAIALIWLSAAHTVVYIPVGAMGVPLAGTFPATAPAPQAPPRPPR